VRFFQSKRKKLLIGWVLLFFNFAAFIAYAIPKIDLLEVNRLLTFNHKKIVEPDNLLFRPLSANNQYNVYFESPLNFFGTFNLYFKRLDDDPVFFNYETASQDFIDNDSNIINRFTIAVSIIDDSGKKIVEDVHHEIYLEKGDAIEYPFGFEPQLYSKNKKYKIDINYLESNASQSEIYGMAFDQNGPVVSSTYHLPAARFSANKNTAANIILLKIVQFGLRSLPSLLVLLTNTLIFILFLKRIYRQNTNFLQPINYGLITHLIIYVVYMLVVTFNPQTTNQFFLDKTYTIASVFILLITQAILSSHENNSMLKPKKVIDILLLLLLITFYIFIRAHHLDKSFYIGSHPGKYTSYVPIAQEMYKASNPFVFRNPTYSDIYSNPQDQQFTRFWRMPILEWTLAPFFSLSSILSQEEIVRLYLTILGSITITLFYLILRKLFTQLSSALAVVLVIFTPLFNILTWTTTLDLPAVLFLLLSLFLFQTKKKEASYLLLGFSYLSKLSFLIIGAPLIFLLIIFNSKNKLFEVLKMAILSIVPFLLFKLLLEDTAARPDLVFFNYSMLVGFALSVSAAYFLVKHFSIKVFNYINCTEKLKLFIIVAALSAVGVTALMILLPSYKGLGEQFITDFDLLFHSGLYKDLITRMRTVSSPLLDSLFILSIPIFFVLPRKNQYFLFSFLATSVLFLVVASKSIRFAAYYNHVFILTEAIFATGLIYFLEKLFRLRKINYYYPFLILFIIALLLSHPKPIKVLDNQLSKYQINYLNNIISQHSEEGDKILRVTSRHKVFDLYTGIPSVQIAAITETQTLNKLRNNIQEIGFYESMNKNNIKLMIAGNHENFQSLLYLFTDEINKTITDRSSLIRSDLDDNFEYYDAPMDEIYEEINPKQYFKPIGYAYYAKDSAVVIYEIIPRLDDVSLLQ